MSTKPSVDSLFAPAAEADGSEYGELTRLAKRCLKLRERADELRRVAREMEQESEKADNDLLTALDAAKIKTLKLESGEGLTSALRDLFQLPPKDREEERASAIAWLRRVGAKEMIEESIHPSTLLSFLRKRLEEGKDISPLIKHVQLKNLRITKS